MSGELTSLLDRLSRSLGFLLHNAQNFVLAHDQILFTIHLDIAAGILAEQDMVAEDEILGVVEQEPKAARQPVQKAS